MQNNQSPRIAAVKAASMTEEQAVAAQALLAGPRGAVRGPFAVLLNSPGVFGPAQELGAYLRFKSSLPANLREIAILVTARHWRQDYEWRVHAALAAESGVSARTIECIASGAEIENATRDEVLVAAYCRQIHQQHDVDEETFRKAQDLVGSAGVIDLCAICGYYALLAMVMNVARNPPATDPSPW